jgi:hypothetical protein
LPDLKEPQEEEGREGRARDAEIPETRDDLERQEKEIQPKTQILIHVVIDPFRMRLTTTTCADALGTRKGGE